MSGLPGTSSVGGGVPTAVQRGSNPENAEQAKPAGAGSVVAVPDAPSTPNGARVSVSQESLAEHLQKPTPAGEESSFRLLLEVGHANVSGWWGRTGKLNYARKCLTDIPKGLIQGLVLGLVAGVSGLIVAIKDRKQNEGTSLLSFFATTQKDFLMWFGLAALATAKIEDAADEAGDKNPACSSSDRDMSVFAQGVRDDQDVTYTPTKIATFGMGAAIGAAVPTVLAAIFFGPPALYMAAKERLSSEEVPFSEPNPSATWAIDEFEITDEVGYPDAGTEANAHE